MRRILRKGPLGSVEQNEFVDVVLIAVGERGGTASRQLILADIEKEYGTQLTDADWTYLPSDPPKIRWVHNVDWARRKLVTDKLISPTTDGPKGTWSLTERGLASAVFLAKTIEGAEAKEHSDERREELWRFNRKFIRLTPEQQRAVIERLSAG